jgi:hypothetical protein
VSRGEEALQRKTEAARLTPDVDVTKNVVVEVGDRNSAANEIVAVGAHGIKRMDVLKVEKRG